MLSYYGLKNSHKRWTKEDELKLREIHKKRMTMQEMVIILQRSVGGVICRIKKLGLDRRLY